jgi:GT2 family glycosyltransferase
MPLIPVTAVVATLDRRHRLIQTLRSVLAQECVPAEWVVVDGSVDPVSAVDLPTRPEGVTLHCLRATERGAAPQRNQGWAVATQPHILFLDDDIDLEAGCVSTLWQRLSDDPWLGGCSALIRNAPYHEPGRIFRWSLSLLGCPAHGSLAGRCSGPALNFLPSAPAGAGASDNVEWLNLGCTLYRADALPRPPFLPCFHGYSLMEDVALSLRVGQHWHLACPAGAWIQHESPPAAYKTPGWKRERMELVNRWYVMRVIQGRHGPLWATRQLGYQLLMLAGLLRSAAGWRRFPSALAGKVAGLASVGLRRRQWRGYSSLRSS